MKRPTITLSATLTLTLSALVFAACGKSNEAPAGIPLCAPTATTPVTPKDDPLSSIRLLRRVSLSLTGRLPNASQVDALEKASTDEARAKAIEDAIEEDLKAPEFYESLVDFGHSWMRTQSFKEGIFGDGYYGSLAGNLATCGPTTKRPGAYYEYRRYDTYPKEHPKANQVSYSDARVCDDLHPNVETPTKPFGSRTVEPWWAPGTTVTLLGDNAGLTTTTVAGAAQPDCGRISDGYADTWNSNGCGCGPNAVWCIPTVGGSEFNLGDKAGRKGSMEGQKRDVWDENARLVAHLGWHDKPLSDIILGDYTVATQRLKHWYVRFAREMGQYAAQQDADSSWWQPDVTALRDPLHPDLKDPDAWREVVQEKLAPNLLSSASGRAYRYDPRTDPGPPKGLPAAGIFTTPGFNVSFPRERPRAARALEVFACKAFNPPPPEQHFADVGADIAKTGACQYCHGVMDPAALSFKRWLIFKGSVHNYVKFSYLADTGNARIPAALFTELSAGGDRAYQYSDYIVSGAERWRSNFKPDTVLTPVSAADLQASPRTMFMDTIPPTSQLFGETPDGTMGPLGLSKILVASGEFDRCAVQKIYDRFVGRKLDPSEETQYIRALAETFVKGDRKLRPFVRTLMKSAEFRRGI
jgi:hypothetical protein